MSELPKFFLASSSPRRVEILRRVGLPFQQVERVPFDENAIQAQNPAEYAEKIAIAKVKNAIVPPDEEGIVLAFDTIVHIDDDILGKPGSPEEAAAYLRRLSGRWHRVFTGVAARRIPDGQVKSSVESSDVLFSELTEDEIELYVASGEPMDKAGAYGIQELGALLVRKVNGCFYNVVGLPLFCLTDVLSKVMINRADILRYCLTQR